MSSDPRQTAVERALATASNYLAAGQLAEALRATKDALALDADSAAAYELLGRIQLTGGQSAEAMESFRAALAREPGREGADRGLGEAALAERLAAERSPEFVLARAAARREQARNVNIAAGISLLIPGLGQARLLEFGRAGIWFVVWLALWGLWSLGNFGLTAVSTRRGGAPVPTALFFIGLFVLLTYHALAAWDCHRLGTQLAAEEEMTI